MFHDRLILATITKKYKRHSNKISKLEQAYFSSQRLAVDSITGSWQRIIRKRIHVLWNLVRVINVQCQCYYFGSTSP